VVAAVPVLHEIIPHGWSRVWLCEMGSTSGENPQGNTLSVPAFLPLKPTRRLHLVRVYRMTGRPHVTS
jgi:hypothetical protein